MQKVVIVGAGVGGLTTAAMLSKAGLDVTVLEAHVYPGGCAGTFYYQGYRFDAGATLAGGFKPGGPMDRIARELELQWPAHPNNPAMVVHLPDGSEIPRWTDERRWEERKAAFGPEAMGFWRWQERTADALWDLALRNPAWPPQSMAQTISLIGDGVSWLGSDFKRALRPQLLQDALRPVSHNLNGASDRLRLFVDAQLLIAAQTTSPYANALYGASALDLPRQGVVHMDGGMGAIAETLVHAIEKFGGRVLYRQEVTNVLTENGRPKAVETKRKDTFPVDVLIFNLPPWNIKPLLGDHLPPPLQDLPPHPIDGWGAFMVYVGLDGSAIPADYPLHHQIVARRPLAEGNTIFLSISPEGDLNRGPLGKRAITLSTHTNLESWWELHEKDRPAYDARKQVFMGLMLDAVEKVLPDIRSAAEVILPGTPVTFQRFTRRAWGWVGGFPQTSLFRMWGPQLDANMWMVGDSIFPGQSTTAVALGGMRVARFVLKEQNIRESIGIYGRTGAARRSKNPNTSHSL
jgi:C-3',4' desaturase CrtD